MIKSCKNTKKNANKLRAMTVAEARERFILHMWGLVNYWENDSRTPTSKEKLEGLLHSILSTLDGNSGTMPGFEIVPLVSKSDIEWMKTLPKGDGWAKNWFPNEDIGGGLHGAMYPIARKHGIIPKTS
jgi:hypothetical protein